jgi:hypothetical protein
MSLLWILEKHHALTQDLLCLTLRGAPHRDPLQNNPLQEVGVDTARNPILIGRHSDGNPNEDLEATFLLRHKACVTKWDDEDVLEPGV